MSVVTFAFTSGINNCCLYSAHIVISSYYANELGRVCGFVNRHGMSLVKGTNALDRGHSCYYLQFLLGLLKLGGVR